MFWCVIDSREVKNQEALGFVSSENYACLCTYELGDIYKRPSRKLTNDFYHSCIKHNLGVLLMSYLPLIKEKVLRLYIHVSITLTVALSKDSGA